MTTKCDGHVYALSTEHTVQRKINIRQMKEERQAGGGVDKERTVELYWENLITYLEKERILTNYSRLPQTLYKIYILF